MNILVSAISGNLGQAICNTIRKHYKNVNIVGTDAINPLQGFGLCDQIIRVPFAKDSKFLDFISRIVAQYNIDIIIPCNDFEVETLNGVDFLNRLTLATKFKSDVNIFDKYVCYREFKRFGISFCDSYLPSNYKSEFENAIVKPRRGSGSKGIVKNPRNFFDFDDSYIVQEYKEGIELTIPFYVNLNNELLGFLALIKYGNAPNNSYQTYTNNNKEIRAILLDIIKSFEVKGPCNLQCIIDDNGIHPFEMNFRFSGSIDIQDQLGFEILRIGIDECISNQAFSEKLTMQNGFAIRRYQSEVFINKNIIDEAYFAHEQSYMER